MRRLPLLWYSRNVSRAHYGMDDDGLFNADCACGVTLAGNEPSTFADAERWHAEQVRKEPREKPCGPALPSGIPGVAPAPDEIAAAEERGRRRGAEDARWREMIVTLRMAADEAQRRVEDNQRPEHWHRRTHSEGQRDAYLAALAAANVLAAIAPRDSAPCPDPPPGALEAAEASARRGGQVGCGNIAMYQAPRDSGKEG